MSIFSCCCINGQCVLGILLVCLSLIAWTLGLQASYDVFQQPEIVDVDDIGGTRSSLHTTTTTINNDFGLLGFCLHRDDDHHHQQQRSHNYLKYTISQEDMFVDIYWRISRYLYVILCVLGLLQIQWLFISYCCCCFNKNRSWLILSSSLQKNRRFLALVSLILSLLPIGILGVLYTSKLCPHSHHQHQQQQQVLDVNDNTVDHHQSNGNSLLIVFLEYSTNNEGINYDYATTATLKELQQEETETELDNNNDDNKGTTTTACIPTNGAFALLLAALIWFFCSIWINCYCCIPSSSSSSSSMNINNNDIISHQKSWKRRRRNRRRGGGRDTTSKSRSATTTTTTTSLSMEPLLGPATRTLGWIAIVIILTLFTTFPYWENAALIAMSPQVAPFAATSTNNGIIIPTQLIGPTIFNPTQNITYSNEQMEWIDPAFEIANILAWVPFGIHLCLSLPIILYGRHQIATYQNDKTCCSCWPNMIMTILALIEIGVAVLCLFIPYSVAEELCYINGSSSSSKFPELRYERSTSDTATSSGDGEVVIWRGVDIKYHSTMSTSCWPTGVGQFLCIGGPILCLVIVGLLIQFILQYRNAHDTFLTFAGGEEDQQQNLLLLDDSRNSRTTSDEDGDDGV